MGGNTGNIRTPRLSASSGSRTYFSMIANTNSSMSYCGGNKRLFCNWKSALNNNIADFYYEQFGLTQGQFASRNNYMMQR